MAEEAWIVNASPIISLAKIGQLHLLHSGSNTLQVPLAVADEILAGSAGDAGRAAIAAGFGGPPVAIEIPPAVGEWSLGRGESAVLALALERGATAIVDDRDARRAALALGIKVLGTLGVVLRARTQGRIPEAAPLLRELRRGGFRLNEMLVAATLEEAFGESWEP